MRAAIHHIQTANGELSKLRSEVLTLEQRILTAQRTLREATEVLGFEEQRAVSAPLAASVAPNRLRGVPLKTNPELCSRVQQALRLDTKKEAEIAVGAVIEALEQTLLNNLSIEGFPLKLGGFGKFKVRHLKPTTRRVGFSGETVTTKAKRKVKFVPLGMLRLSENVG
jgi:nucleoid DNA-binding protein